MAGATAVGFVQRTAASLLGTVLLLFSLQGGVLRADEGSGKMEDLKLKEVERRRELVKWSREAHPPQDELMVKLLDPVFKGNTEDYAKNMDWAEKFKGRAKDAADNRQQETAEKYAKVAKLFYDAAQVNKQIVTSLKERDGAKLDEGFKQIEDIEAQIYALTGKRVYREWFTPEELRQAALRATAGKSGQAPAEQKQQPAPETKSEAPAAK